MRGWLGGFFVLSLPLPCHIGFAFGFDCGGDFGFCFGLGTCCGFDKYKGYKEMERRDGKLMFFCLIAFQSADICKEVYDA